MKKIKRVLLSFLLMVTLSPTITATAEDIESEEVDLSQTIENVLVEEEVAYSQEELEEANEIVNELSLSKLGAIHTRLAGRDDLTKNEELLITAVKGRVVTLGLTITIIIFVTGLLFSGLYNKRFGKNGETK